MAVQLVKILSVVHFDPTGQTYLCIGPLAAWAGGGRSHTRKSFLRRISLEGSFFPLCEGKLKCRSGLATCDGKQTTASKSARSQRATPFLSPPPERPCEHAVCAVVNIHARCRSREHTRVAVAEAENVVATVNSVGRAKPWQCPRSDPCVSGLFLPSWFPSRFQRRSKHAHHANERHIKKRLGGATPFLSRERRSVSFSTSFSCVSLFLSGIIMPQGSPRKQKTKTITQS